MKNIAVSLFFTAVAILVSIGLSLFSFVSMAMPRKMFIHKMTSL